MFQISPDDASGLLTGLTVYGGMVLAALWLAMVIWAFRDMRSRSRDLLAQLLVAVMVALLTFPGLLIYLFLRPRETLSEAYERSLEEEALLQEIEEKPVCPGCRQRINEDWQACPNCHTRLKKACTRCGKMLELSWDLCPYCAASQPAYASEKTASTAPTGYGHARPAATETWMQPAVEQQQQRSGRPRRASRASSEPLEFLEGDEP